MENRGIGIQVAMGGELTLTDASILRTQGRTTDGRDGRGLELLSGAHLEAERVFFEGNRRSAMWVFGEGTTARLTDVVVRGTLPRVDGGGGRGLNVGLSATVELRRVLVDGNREVGLFLTAGGMTSEDLVIRGTQPQDSDGTGGRGLSILGPASVDLRRSVISQNHDIGVMIDERASVRFDGLAIRDTKLRRSDGAFGRGLNLQRGAQAELSNAILEGNWGTAVFASGDETSLTITDALIGGSGAEAEGSARRMGMSLQSGAQVELGRVLVEDSREIGVFVIDETTRLTAHDLVVRDIQSGENDGLGGRGVNIQNGRADLSRVRIERTRDIGLGVLFGANADTEDALILDTLPRSCAEDECSSEPFGLGAAVVGATLQLRRFAIRDSSLCGVFVEANGVLDLMRGEIQGAPIGACVQVDGYDLSLLQDQVDYRDNGVGLESTSLPVPEAVAPSW